MLESSIPALLRERASLRPDEVAFTYVDYEQDWAGVEESLTWSQLYRQTLNVARALKASGSTGDRAVIAAPQGLEYIVAFLGALEAGQIAVPLSVPQGGASDERFISVLSDASPSAILTTSSVAGNIAEYIDSRSDEVAPSVIEVDSLDLDAETGPIAETETPPDIAYLQYTSGSTRTPAGVEISHKNIHVNVDQILSSYYQDRGGAPPETTVVSWLPFFHDMGLVVGIVIPIQGGFPAVVTSPASFLQRPARWIQLMARNRQVFTAGPNVAFELAAAKTSDDDMAGLDLGGVRNILNGAERVQPATLRRFAKRFAPFNLRPEVLRPSYGLAEATVYVATRESDQPPLTVHFESEELTAGRAKPCAGGDGTPLVSYGMPQSPTVRIVDPETRIECPAGTVGEIWSHGDNVASGYWQRPEETERTFGATLLNPAAGTPEGPWLRTGDLGFLSDGEMFIIGRIKDLLIVYGRNHSADDIESTIQEITAGRCVAIAVPEDDGPEKLVTIVELKVRGDSDEAMELIRVVKRKITSAISKSHGLSVADLVLVRPHSIPITTSGKVRRRDCLQLYLRNEFTRVDAQIRPPAPRVVADTGPGVSPDSGLTQRVRTLHQQQHDLLVGVVCAQVATVLGRPGPDDIDPEGEFQDLGFDSVKSTELLDRLKTLTELELPLTLAFDYPTPNALATHLGQMMTGSGAGPVPVQAQAAVDEPVAVVGMACRFPGGVDSAAALWDLVAGGIDAMGEFPGDRGWNLADLYDPDPDAVGKTYTRTGGFLTDVAGFDAEFFGISGREAQSMDPQQRLLLEVCWEALETARIDPAGLVGSETGVFIGAWSQTYGSGGSDGAEGYALTGLSTSVASGRVAYALGLQGPAITLDTACSSSLVATHLACQSLRNGESTLALAGGVTAMTTPAVFTEFARQRGLAADGRCKTFSGNADGTGWGEGAAVLVLERLSDAHRNNHPVLAVIAGSAINQDGASNGLAAPNGPAQQRVITQAVANAGIGLDQVDVVEAHGTGTALGDPIEAGALIATYGAARTADRPLWLGSIKSNIGHTQAASGAAGIIKMVAALNHDSLPPTLNVDHPSPHIDWSAGTVRLLTEPAPWPDNDHPRTAAVSSFGISGTNAHMILQQPSDPPAGLVDPRRQPRQTRHGDEFGLPIWPVSARTPAALGAQADRLRQHLVDHPDLDLTDAAYSLATILSHKPAGEPVRCWVAGCATGEEAYSVAICLLETLGSSSRKIQIFATDISEKAIAKARIGRYRKSEMEGISPERLSQFFTKLDGDYQINKSVRELCVFAQHNLLKDPPFSKIDLITCRNVLIYLEPILQKRAFTIFHYALNEQGALMLGKSETVGTYRDLFRPSVVNEKIYFRIGEPGRFMSIASSRNEETLRNLDKASNPSTGATVDIYKKVDEVILSKYAMPGVLINEHLDIVQFRGITEPWLAPTPGKASLNLLKMAREGLGFELRNLLHTAKLSNTAVKKTGIVMKFNDKSFDTTVDVYPFMDAPEVHYLVMFKNSERPDFSHQTEGPSEGQAVKNNGTNSRDLRIEQLEKELLQTREDMRNITEEQEAVNEELQSANEELLSGSEELQTLNEELETSKEELQSTNEELSIVNHELIDRNEQLTNARKYSETIISTIRDPLVVLDKNFVVKNATEGFYKMFRVNEPDTEEKSIFELGNSQWDIPQLHTMLKEILPKNKHFADFEVTHDFPVIGQRSMLLNGRMDKVNGEEFILLAIEDITDRKKVEEGVLALKKLNAILETSNQELEQFAFAASHDLQEPLRKILSFANLIVEKEPTLSVQAKSFIEKITAAAYRMDTLIKDLLNFSRISYMGNNFTRISPNAVVNDVVNDLELIIKEKSAVLNISPLPQIEGISHQIHQLFYNLVNNALKFNRTGIPPVVSISAVELTPEEIKFHPRLRKELNYIEIKVSDNGIGLKEQFKEKIFLLFQRLNQPGLYPGSGIGLALCRKIVNNHSGEIYVASIENEGSVFHIILPVKQA